jgi:hypothetical protein
MSTTAIAEFELSVPGNFVALFRASLIDEVDNDANWIKQNTAEVSEFYATADDIEDVDELAKMRELRLADLSSPVRCLADDYGLLERIARHTPGPGRDLTIHGSYETLHGALQATIRRAAKELVDECEYAPIDGGRVVHRSQAAIWAAEEIERLDTEYTGGDA